MKMRYAMICLKSNRWKENMVLYVLLLELLIYGVHCNRFKRIIGGSDTGIKMVPYMLSMRLNDKHICGAVIIGQNWSLTAAHCCIDPPAPEILTMRSGSTYLDDDTSATVHEVTKKVRLPKYQDDDDDYDLCAVQVEPNFRFSDFVRPVRLPEPGVPLHVNWGLVSGWGSDKVGQTELSPTLKSVVVPKVNLKICKNAYRNTYTVHDDDICYGFMDNTVDTCQGDSGGPLVNKYTILIGIVSFGFDCGFSNLPGVYTDITKFRSWIKNVTKI